MQQNTLSSTTNSPPNASPSDGAASVGLPAGEDVMRIIADVETQLQRIRSAQKTHDDALAALSQRTEALRRAEEEVARARQELQRDRDALAKQRSELESHRQHLESQVAEHREQSARELKTIEADRIAATAAMQEAQAQGKKLDADRAQWDHQRSQDEKSLKARESELDRTAAQIQSRESELARERERVTTIEAESKKLQDELRAQSDELETRSRELQERVDKAERNVGELIAKLESTNSLLSERSTLLERAAADATAAQGRVSELEKQLKQATQRAEAAEQDTAEMARLADQQRSEIEKKLADATAELQAAARARDVALAQADELQKNLEQLQSQYDSQQARLLDSQKKFEVAGKKLAEFAAVLAEQTPQLERGAAALVMVEQQQGQIERLTKELAQYKLSVDPSEMQSRDRRIHELTEALRQARGQSAGAAGVAELEQQNAELTSKVDELKIEVERLTLAHEEAQTQLEQFADNASAEQSHQALVTQHNARVAALNAEIEQLRSEAASDLQTKLEEQSRRHEQKLAESHKADVAEIETMRSRIDQLETELAAAKTKSGKSKGDATDQGRKLKEKAEKITAVAEHLRRRRARLERMRELVLAKQVRGDVEHREQTADDVRAIDEQKHRISEARRALAEAEKEMVRRWARPRAAATIAWVGVLAAICAAASWLVAGQMFPAVIAASAVLEARNTSRSALTEEQAAQWKTWHQDLFNDATFMQILSKRLAERRLDAYATPQAIAKKLGDDLTIDASQKGALILTLSGDNEGETTALLDIVAATAAAESFRTHGNRHDGAWASLAGERNEGGRLRYSSVNPVPIKDERFKAAGPIFGVTFAVCLGLIAVAYTRLIRAKRVFEQGHTGLFTEVTKAAA